MTTRASRRDALRAKRSFPHGKFSGLLVAVFVTLIGVFLRLDPVTILIRASVSAIVIGTIVSLGVGVVRLTDSENKKQLSKR
jgi:pilus assembly protein TadC